MMNEKVVPDDELTAYRLAAIGVTGFALGVRVRSLTMEFEGRVEIEPLAKFCRPSSPELYEQKLVEDYLTVLVAGNVGVALQVERHFGLTDANNPWARRKVAFAKLPTFPELEQAFTLAFAWLKEVDNGNPERTIERLYRAASKLLRRAPHFQRLPLLADELLNTRLLTKEQLLALMENWGR